MVFLFYFYKRELITTESQVSHNFKTYKTSRLTKLQDLQTSRLTKLQDLQNFKTYKTLRLTHLTLHV